MLLFDSPLCAVSQGWLSGWKVKDKMSGAISIPDSLLKERIGFVWMQVRSTKKSQSINSNMSEEVMFGSFAQAVLDPSGPDGALWRNNSPDQLADHFIHLGNGFMRGVI